MTSAGAITTTIPTTPRHAQGVDRVQTGTELTFTYLTTSATQRRQVADILSQSLRACGIGVNVVHISQMEFYAEGPAGPLFGRAFDVAVYAMSTLTAQPPCARFTIAEIPSADNRWVGTNVSGYQNPAFDAACLAARQSLPDETTYVENYHLTQTIFCTGTACHPALQPHRDRRGPLRLLQLQPRSDRRQRPVRHRDVRLRRLLPALRLRGFQVVVGSATLIPSEACLPPRAY